MRHNKISCSMSALGQKRTFYDVRVASGLPPKADINDVRVSSLLEWHGGGLVAAIKAVARNKMQAIDILPSDHAPRWPLCSSNSASPSRIQSRQRFATLRCSASAARLIAARISALSGTEICSRSRRPARPVMTTPPFMNDHAARRFSVQRTATDRSASDCIEQDSNAAARKDCRDRFQARRPSCRVPGTHPRSFLASISRASSQSSHTIDRRRLRGDSAVAAGAF